MRKKRVQGGRATVIRRDNSMLSKGRLVLNKRKKARDEAIRGAGEGEEKRGNRRTKEGYICESFRREGTGRQSKKETLLGETNQD